MLSKLAFLKRDNLLGQPGQRQPVGQSVVMRPSCVATRNNLPGGRNWRFRILKRDNLGQPGGATRDNLWQHISGERPYIIQQQ